MTYLSIIAAIPRKWKVEIRNFTFIDPLDEESNLEILIKSEQVSKMIYWNIIDKRYPPTLALKKIWENDLNTNISEESWWRLYPTFLKTVKPTKLRILQYRILTKSLTTNVKRHIWDNTISEKCTFCENCTETLLHLFVYCKYVQTMWKSLTRWCKRFLLLEIVFNPEMICFNNYNGQQEELINTFFIILKRHIYVSKCYRKIHTFLEFCFQIVNWYNIEETIAENYGNYKKFSKKWKQYVEM